MSIEPQEKKPGRPRMALTKGTFSFRVTTDLRGKLEEASAQSGRPVSEEITKRLEWAFEAGSLAEMTERLVRERLPTP